MIINETKIQSKALSNYLDRLIGDLNKLDTKTTFDEEGGEIRSERSEYIYSSFNEWQRIIWRYRKLRDDLASNYPKIFSDLMDTNSGLKIHALEELSREITFILETLSELETESEQNSNGWFAPSDWEITNDNSPFTEKEQEVVVNKLDELKDLLLNVASEQEQLPDVIEKTQNRIEQNIEDLKTSSSKIGRKDFLLQLFSLLVNVSTALVFSTEARGSLIIIVKVLYAFIQSPPLLLM